MADDEKGEQPVTPEVAAEQALLGCALRAGDELADLVDAVLVRDFSQPRHSLIWGAVLELYSTGDPVNWITVGRRLDQDGVLAKVGGAPRLESLTRLVPPGVSAGHYAGIVAENGKRRRVIEIGSRIARPASGVSADELIEQAQAAVLELSDFRRGAGGVTTLDAAVDAAFERLASPAPPTISTGLIDLDEILTGGLRAGDVYVIAARPGLGKSLVGANVALNVAQSGMGVLISSLEMSTAEVANRLLANAAGVELASIMRHRLNDFDWHQLKKVRDQVRGVPLLIQDNPDTTVPGIWRHCERIAQQPSGLSLVVVDYAQLVTAVDRSVPRQEQVAEISRSLKRMAGKLGIPVLMISQTNRKDGERENPTMGDLRESGSLEADASVVMILRRPPPDSRAGELDVHVVKNRHGGEGVVALSYSPHYSRVRSLARGYREAAA